MGDSFLTKKVVLYREYFTRDMVGYTYGLANLLSMVIWFILLVLPFIIGFT